MRGLARAALTAAFIIAALQWSLADEQPYARDGSPAVPPQFAQSCQPVAIRSVIIGLHCCNYFQRTNDKVSRVCISIPLREWGKET